MKKRCALISNVKNEEIILPLWLSYYTRFFHPSDIYVGDDSSTDSTTSILKTAGVAVDVVPPCSCEENKHRHLVKYNAHKMTELLKTYEAVLFVESDEFIVPALGTLGEFLTVWTTGSQSCQACKDEVRASSDKESKCRFHQVQTSTNVEIIQDIDNERELDLTMPIMAQRSHALNVPKFNNSQLWSVPPRWTSGYHNVRGLKLPPSQTLWLVHIHHIDFKSCNERHKARKQFVDNIIFAVEVDAELEEFFRNKLNNPSLYYGYPRTMEIPPEVKTAF